MNYKKIYDDICNNAKERNWQKKTAPSYVERHHIIPKSLGGDDSEANLVFLTAREHFICHVLLVKFTLGSNKFKMSSALSKMMQKNKFQDRNINSRFYEVARKLFNENNPYKQEHVIVATKLRMSSDKNPMRNPEVKKKRKNLDTSGEKNNFYGKKHTEDTIERLSGDNHYSRKPGYMRKPTSQITSEKIRQSKLGKKREDLADYNREKSAMWEIHTPQGEIFIIKNLNSWAKENNIKPHILYTNRKGYKAIKL